MYSAKNLNDHKKPSFPQIEREVPLISQKITKQLADQNMLMNFQDPMVLKKNRQEIARKKYDMLLKQVQFYNGIIGFTDEQLVRDDEKKYVYTSETLRPLVYFFKILARRPEGSEEQIKSTINRLRLWIPDTIVLNDGDLPNMWFYSNQEGFVFRTDNISSKNVSTKLANYASPDELVAVIKKGQFGKTDIIGNSITLVSARDLPMITTSAFQNKSELTVIQKFVKSNGPKAFICRTCWRKDRNAYSWIITSKTDFYSEEKIPDNQKYIVQPKYMQSCTIVNTCRGKYVDETIPYIENLLKYMWIHLRVSFKEFTGDFIKDESGNWWIINVKAFVLDQYNVPINVKQITNFPEGFSEQDDPNYQQKPVTDQKYSRQKIKMCKYCEEYLSETDLCHKMTLKMIIQTDKHLMHRGLMDKYLQNSKNEKDMKESTNVNKKYEKGFKWLERSNITNLDTPLLYQEHKVCAICYKLYTETEKLLEIEFLLNQKLGIPITEETKYNLVNIETSSSEVQEEDKNVKDMYGGALKDQYQNGNVPDTWAMDIGHNTQLKVENNIPVKNYDTEKIMHKYRFMIILNNMRDIPNIPELNTKNYYLQFKIFEQTCRYTLDFSNKKQCNKNNEDIMITLNKLRIFYFFCPDRKGVNNFLSYKDNIPTGGDYDDVYMTQHKPNSISLEIQLFCDNRQIGIVELELADFMSDKIVKREYLKLFSGKNTDIPILKWGLNATIGLYDSGLCNISKIKIHEHKGLYLPPKDYYSCELLPKEWIDIIKERNDTLYSSKSNNQSQQSIKKSHQQSLQKEGHQYHSSSQIRADKKKQLEDEKQKKPDRQDSARSIKKKLSIESPRFQKEVKFAETTQGLQRGNSTTLQMKQSGQFEKNYDYSEEETELLNMRSYLLKDIGTYSRDDRVKPLKKKIYY